MEKVELRYWWEHSDEKNMNKLVEWKVFVDTYGIKSDGIKIKSNERPQIAICCLEWLSKLKCLGTGFYASLFFLSTSRRCSLNRSPSRRPVSPMYIFLQ